MGLSRSDAAPPAAPTNLTASAEVFGELVLNWEDNSDDEDGFIVQVQTGEDSWVNILTTAPDAEEIELFGGVPAATDIFRIVATNADGSTPSAEVSYMAFDSFVSRDHAHIRLAEPFSFNAVANNTGGATSVTYGATGLPEGLTIDPATGEISGSTTQDGFFDAILEATYGDPAGTPARDRFRLRIAPEPGSPIVTKAFSTLQLSAGLAATTLGLPSHFEDPDTRDAVQIVTSAGTMVASLHHRATPLPVENFLNYVDRRDYTDSVFHRSVNAATFDIIQAGSFVGDANSITSIPTDPPIVNAPGIPNDRGTLAYARTTNPDSATAGWYINAQDSPGLDAGDSYTVFGRLTHASYPVMDQIFGYPTGTHTLNTNGFPQPWNDFPTTDGNAPAIGPPTNLIIVEGISRVPALTFAIESNSAPAVGTVAVTDIEGVPHLEVTPLSPGITEVVVSATDVDGNTVTAPVSVTVLESYASWAANNGAGSPSDRSDAGSLTDLQEYGFGGDPTDGADDLALLPETAVVKLEATSFDALTLRHRTNANDLSYTVEASNNLEDWTTVWQTSDGFDSAAIATSVQDGDFRILTVRLPDPNASTNSIYLRSTLSLMVPQ